MALFSGVLELVRLPIDFTSRSQSNTVECFSLYFCVEHQNEETGFLDCVESRYCRLSDQYRATK